MRNVFRILVILICLVGVPGAVLGQRNASHPAATMSPEARALLEEAIAVVCTQAKLDPKSSFAIDAMQALPSMPVAHPEAQAGAERAQRLLPVAKQLVVASLRQLI